jgi:hypothetical protein
MKQFSSLLVVGALTVGSAQAGDDLVQAIFASTQGVSAGMQAGIAQQLAKKGYVAQAGQVATAKCGVVPIKNEIKDLNGDGLAEVLMLIGNACTSGTIGSTMYLFTQEADGSVQRHFGFSASGYEFFPSKKPNPAGDDAWPAVLVKGTGDCQPVWGYHGGRYGFDHLYENKKGACYVPQSDNVGG